MISYWSPYAGRGGLTFARSPMAFANVGCSATHTLPVLSTFAPCAPTTNHQAITPPPRQRRYPVSRRPARGRTPRTEEVTARATGLSASSPRSDPAGRGHLDPNLELRLAGQRLRGREDEGVDLTVGQRCRVADRDVVDVPAAAPAGERRRPHRVDTQAGRRGTVDADRLAERRSRPPSPNRRLSGPRSGRRRTTARSGFHIRRRARRATA